MHTLRANARAYTHTHTHTQWPLKELTEKDIGYVATWILTPAVTQNSF